MSGSGATQIISNDRIDRRIGLRCSAVGPTPGKDLCLRVSVNRVWLVSGLYIRKNGDRKHI